MVALIGVSLAIQSTFQPHFENLTEVPSDEDLVSG